MNKMNNNNTLEYTYEYILKPIFPLMTYNEFKGILKKEGHLTSKGTFSEYYCYKRLYTNLHNSPMVTKEGIDYLSEEILPKHYKKIDKVDKKW
jgi:hypothetical protein